MKTKLLSIAALTLVMNSNANNKLLNDSSSNNKNEVHINIMPIIAPLATGSSNRLKYSLIYKRAVRPHGALRFGVSLTDINNSASSAEYFDKSDIHTKYDYANSNARRISALAGYELRKQLNRLILSVGADLSYGIYKANRNVKKSVFKDEVSGGIITRTYFTMEDMENHIADNIIAVSPNVGAKYSVTKNIAISAQFGVDFAYVNRTTDVVTYNPTTTNTTTTNFFSISSNNLSLLNELSVVYLF